MLCRLDIRKAVLDDVFNKFINGRYTFRQVSENSVILLAKEGTKGRITSRAQAWAVANELRKRINEYYKGGVLAQVTEGDISQPIAVTFGVSNKYIDHLEVMEKLKAPEPSPEAEVILDEYKTLGDLTPEQLSLFGDFYKLNQNVTEDDALSYFLKCKI